MCEQMIKGVTKRNLVKCKGGGKIRYDKRGSLRRQGKRFIRGRLSTSMTLRGLARRVS